MITPLVHQLNYLLLVSNLRKHSLTKIFLNLHQFKALQSSIVIIHILHLVINFSHLWFVKLIESTQSYLFTQQYFLFVQD